MSAAAPATEGAVRIPVADLERWMSTALERREVAADHRAMVVNGLLRASLRGIDTHGIRLFPTYLAELDGGRAQAQPVLRWNGGVAEEGDSPKEVGEDRLRAAHRLDAGAALGLVAGTVAARRAVRLAQRHGVGAVSVSNSNHFGAASVYTLEMADAGCLGMSFTNSDALVAPFSGRRRFFGTNPLSMAVAGVDGEMLCVDMATSQVSYSRVKKLRQDGADLDAGWAVTADGVDAAGVKVAGVANTASADTDEIALKPLGGYKGECLGLMVEVLCSLLAGTPFDHELSHLYVPPFDEPRQVAHLFLALDPGAFTDPDSFRARLGRLLTLLRQEPPARQGERVLAPGDLEAACAAERRATGIPLDSTEVERFQALDAELPEGLRLGL